MNSYGLCDGVDDCGDNSDESSENCRKLQVMSCSFEQFMGGLSPCNWTQEVDSGSNSMWKTMKSVIANTDNNMLRMTGPTFDHTFELAKT